jgi:hypothetical protein
MLNALYIFDWSEVVNADDTEVTYCSECMLVKAWTEIAF